MIISGHYVIAKVHKGVVRRLSKCALFLPTIYSRLLDYNDINSGQCWSLFAIEFVFSDFNSLGGYFVYGGGPMLVTYIRPLPLDEEKFKAWLSKHTFTQVQLWKVS